MRKIEAPGGVLLAVRPFQGNVKAHGIAASMEIRRTAVSYDGSGSVGWKQAKAVRQA
ncbi:hypothetical protein LP419_37505 [Massilia sp. H-1]|nr:hypothetical protein LP419_37505 [Massilia sp. H-1]